MNTKSLLIIITVLLVAILGFMAYQESQKPQTPGEKLEAAMEQGTDAIGEAVEDAGNQMQDAAQ